MSSENMIQKKNLLAEIEVVKNEISEKSLELASILGKIDAHKSNLMEFEESKKRFDELTKKKESDFKLKSDELQEAKKKHEVLIHEALATLSSKNKDIKEATKQLLWINDKIMKGEDDIETLLIKKLKLDNDVGSLLILVSNKEEEERKLRNAENSRLAIEGAIENKRLIAEQYISDVTASVTKLKSELAAMIIDRDRAESDAKMYHSWLNTAKLDYQIVRQRLEVRFKEQYPELELPIMQ